MINYSLDSTIKSYSITETAYNYLLPVGQVYRSKHLLCRSVDSVLYYYFIGNDRDFEDFITRCKYLRS